MKIVKASVQAPKELRTVYMETLSQMMAKNPQIIAMDADLVGASGTAKLFKAFPERCINMGISEANMMGAAAGMSLYGKIPFIHTFAPFATRRVYDQLYMVGVYQQANVKIYGSDPGYLAIHNGGTHTSMEDIAITRVLPGLTVLSPCDATQFVWCLNKAAETYGCFYIRAGRKGTLDLYDPSSEFELGKGIILEEGNDVVMFAVGDMVSESLKVKAALESEGISVMIVDLFSIKPLDTELIRKVSVGKKLIVSVENHSKIGGIGSAVAEVLAENAIGVPLLRIAVNDRFSEVGTADYLSKTLELDPESIIRKIKANL
jgi:transketolase